MTRDEERGFDSPEEAALSAWDPEWKAHVLRIDVENDDSLYVFVDTEPSHPMRVHCERTDGRWRVDKRHLRMTAQPSR